MRIRVVNALTTVEVNILIQQLVQNFTHSCVAAQLDGQEWQTSVTRILTTSVNWTECMFAAYQSEEMDTET